MSSTPTTPIRSLFSTPESGTAERKIMSMLEPHHNYVDDVTAWKCQVKQLLLEAGDLTPSKLARLGEERLAASSLTDLDFIVSLLDIDYFAIEDRRWKLPIGRGVRLSEATESLLRRMLNAIFWKRESCEALSRTFFDLVIFDLLEANNASSARPIHVFAGMWMVLLRHRFHSPQHNP
ncbi:hypothetical protein ASPZODRAFT_138752 [Penicilliopsis zonata CBS 506.65]|uniref:Uncharacterized protein n=1 Tax=Penicilliopsis zonata CBS 506.65 TaxID=1073090 RepID=A0A1L9SWV0_9EURO|nr:hypothetical protein ASPZODRAFT_138752 [Penicilliopsis zonata CBS 506.65]OJJ51678.1 hypothetical protein ASPZODRAFT_138752 [Penicilliopsis zonata CBS 506.65]